MLLSIGVSSMANIKIAVNSIKGIKPGAKDIVVWDTELSGFGFKVTPSGSRSFILSYRVGNVQRKPMIGRYPTIQPEAARNIAKDWLADIRKGGDPSADRQLRRKTSAVVTLSQMVELFLNAKAGKRSIKEMERIFRKDILPVLGSVGVEDITKSHVTKLLDDLLARAPGIARLARANLSSFYNWAIPRLSDTAINPVVGSSKVPFGVSRDRVLNEEEVRGLWTVLATEPDKWELALKILILTGQRKKEVLEADWREIDLEKGEWVIPAERAKNGKVHSVPLSDQAVELMQKIPHRTGRLFPGTGPVSRTAKRVRVKLEAEISVPVQPWAWHDIRRTVATGMQRLGVRSEVTEAVLNHKNGMRSGVAAIYQRHEWTHEKRDALDKWSAEVARIVRG